MSTVVSEEALKRHGWSDLSLRQYQLEGVNWLLSCYSNNHGCILGDEMGLGKTCQTIAMLTWLTATSGNKRPHLVVCPRSVLENWVQEFSRFAPKVKVKAFIGDKETRANISQTIKKSRNGLGYCFDVLVTTYEICLKDFLFLQSLSWHVAVVDEGHRLKNSDSLLYRTLEQWDIPCHVLLTGTPIQNHLGELYALLAFIDRKQFRPSRLDSFVGKYNSSQKDIVEELHNLLKPYLLRRTKSGVLKDLPEKSDVVLYHGLSKLQKKLYKAILMKDFEAFENPYGTGQTRLMNILMQLRKCVNHPYLFDGVEPEPFELGDHLVEASAKLVLIDHLLKWLQASGHKVLLFSQMTHMLDIVQDYLGYRGFTYERLDGSVRGEERFLAVQNFNQNDETFVFLLSTKAGGQGLNLTAADTVIFIDSDFNPQNDLQAAARAHRIGQNRPVKVIRLIGRNTVEEIILKRAEDKLKLTDTVIEKGEFHSVEPSTSKTSFSKNIGQLQDILKFGVDMLLKEEAEEEEVDFTNILGPSVGGEWQVDEADQQGEEEEEEEEKEEEEEGMKEAPQSMYMFEGHDYSKETKDTSAADADAFQTLVQLAQAEKEENSAGERTLRRKGTMLLTGLLPETGRKARIPLTPEELEARRKKRQQAAEKRAQKAAEEKQRKREALWKKHNYHSVNIVIDSEGEEEEEEEGKEEEEEGKEEEEEREGEGDKPGKSINYVIGDVTRPLAAAKTSVNIVIHCADDSGYWGRGGLFSAISSRSKQPQKQYELAGKVRDLALGDCHLIPMTASQRQNDEEDDTEDLLGLIIAQTRDRHHRLSGIKLPALREGLEKVYHRARGLKASVHLPRIGHDTPGFNWYGTERLIQKILASKGIPTYIYYFPRKKALKRKQSDPASPPAKLSKDDDDDGDDDTDDYNDDTPSTSRHNQQKNSSASSTVLNVPPKVSASTSDEFLSGVAVHLYGLPLDSMTKYKRDIITYDGDVDSYVHGSTTHLVVSPETDLEEVKKVRGGHGCHVVSSDWLDQCLLQHSLLPTDPYTVHV
ncbi:chromodomain-helicase-DNA-binding protein 1-like [Babylonia areolata]|uniref:chromodomain-helicase-DNA-binding protein 1-like n=1 Tax=Babylonia areolata TaxID=304850 RepID=UPI003FD5F07F